MGKRRSVFLCALALALALAWTSTQALAAVLESPAAGATVSGIGSISGWKCEAGEISVSLDRGIPVFVAMDLSRGDTRGVCGGEDENGFLLQINWALLGDGVHTIVAYDDQIEFARSTFTVTSTGEEFIRGAEAEVVIDDFPRKGESTLFAWNQSTQHLEMLPDPTQQPSSAFDGTWEIQTRYTAPGCTHYADIYATSQISGGSFSDRFSSAGEQFQVSGTVLASGLLRSTSHLDGSFLGGSSGRLQGREGSGRWYNTRGCSGTWTSTKQSSSDHTTGGVCTTRRGLRVEDYDGDPGRWNIVNPCAPWNGYANVLHIDIVPLVQDGFLTDAEDLLIVQGNRRVTYDYENPNLTVVWVDRESQTAVYILEYRLTQEPYRTTVVIGPSTGLDLRQPFTVYYAENLVAIFE